MITVYTTKDLVNTLKSYFNLNSEDHNKYVLVDDVVNYVPAAPTAPTLSIAKADGKITISWNAVSGANKYWIYRSTDGTNFKYYDMTTKTSYSIKKASFCHSIIFGASSPYIFMVLKDCK